MDEIGEDIVTKRGEVLAHVAEQLDKTKNEKARRLLLAYMEKVVQTLPVPKGAELHSIEGGKACSSSSNHRTGL